MITFPKGGSLPQLQQYVHDKCQERGFNNASNLEIFLLLSEEIGELAKAWRKYQGLFQEQGKTKEALQKRHDNLGEEMADVLSYLLDLANRFEVDLEEAFRRKEALNDQRLWEYQAEQHQTAPHPTDS